MIWIGGLFEIAICDASKKELWKFSKRNLIVTQGLLFCCRALTGQETRGLHYIALGRSVPSGPYATRLGAEIVRKRAQVSISSGSDGVILVAEFENVHDITEIGVFYEEQGDTLFAYTTTSALNAPFLIIQYSLYFAGL